MSDLTVAKTILKQLGGGRFIAMTGSKGFIGSDDSLSFRVGRNSSRVTHVIIKLNSFDLYDVDYVHIRGSKRETVDTSIAMYFDQLRGDFERKTGMAVSMGTCGGAA